MQNSKDLIKYNFDRASSSYDSAADIQRKCAQRLVDMLLQHMPSFCPLNVLDLGTGTGFVPEYLLRAFPASAYMLNDISEAMLMKAEQKLSSYTQKISYHQGDMEHITMGEFDLITSNLALQWASDACTVIKKMNAHTKVAAFSCLLEGTFREWHQLLQASSLPTPQHHYPSLETMTSYLSSLPGSSSIITQEVFEVNFKNPRDFATHIKQIGANTANVRLALSEAKHFFTKETAFKVSYKVLFVLLERIEI